ncbi:MAG: Uma2 family endonuclease [Sphingomonadales bacterium]|nr:MAG: Uma2 family endonuclease [Sphingomonadales bacterium]
MNKPSARLEADRSFRARFTTAEFVRMGEFGAFDDMKVELVEGELERMNPPMNTHSARQTSVMIRLSKVLDEALLRGEIGIDLGNDTVLACDVAVLRIPVTGHRLLRPEEAHLIVEIAETTRSRDMGLKRVLYATAGIPHYWVVDGDRSVVHVYREPSGGDYSRVSTIGFGEPLDVPGIDATIVVD